MRFIGIQALLTLLENRAGAAASGSGIGHGIGVSNAGIFAQAHGIGAAFGVSGINDIAVHAAGFGAANGVGVSTGAILGVGASSGHGAADAVGSATGLVAAAASTSGAGAASAVGQAPHAIEATASASGVGQSLGASPTEDDVPNGRLTLSTGVPVMTSSVTGATIVYYTPYKGNKALVTTDGVNFLSQTFTELSQATTDATKSPAAVAASSIYDMFVWNDGGTLRCTRGPAWSSDTSRGTGAGTSELQLVSGIYTNKNAITNGPGAGLGTYVGSIRSNGSSTIDFNIGGAGSGGVQGFLYVWNYFNRVLVHAQTQDTAAPYTYTSATIRLANNSAGNQINFLSGLAEDAITMVAKASMSTTGVLNASIGQYVSIDSTSTATTPPCFCYCFAPTANIFKVWGTLSMQYAPQLGAHYIARLEQSDSVHANTTNADTNGGDHLHVQLMM